MKSIRFPERITELTRLGSRMADEKIIQLKENGHEILPLSAYPDRKLPAGVIAGASEELGVVAHPPARGLPGLLEALAAYQEQQTGRVIDPTGEVLITCGAMHALQCIMLALLDHGDEVLLFTPSYFFDGTIVLAGGKLIPVSLKEEERFCWCAGLLEKSITPRTRAILLNTPTNPTGYVATSRCLNEIAELAEKHELFLICDESYDRLIYDGARHVSILTVRKNRERTILVGSFTKSFSMAAWRVGYVVASPPVTDAVLKVLEWSILFAPHINQKVAELVLRSDLRWLKGVEDEFQANRDLMAATLKRCPEISFVVPRGNPFVFINCNRFQQNDNEVFRILLERYGIPCTPGFLHKAEGYIRVPFGGPKAVVEEAARRLVRAISEIKKETYE